MVLVNECEDDRGQSYQKNNNDNMYTRGGRLIFEEY